jgi:glycosyltransferase involved in cell wall biosynthesis
MRLLFVVNVAWFFKSHRLPIALEALRHGFEVHLASAFVDERERNSFEVIGIRTHPVNFQRSGTSALAEFGTVKSLHAIYRRTKPSICHHVSIKPVIYGGMLTRLLGIPTVNAVSGLGYSYIARGAKARLRQWVLNRAYGLAVRNRKSRLIVQNSDDETFFREEIGVHDDWVTLIRGSGVDLNRFHPSRPPATPPLVVLPARMLADKGVGEFVEAARELRRKGVAARFALVGGLDPENRAGLSQADMDDLTRDGVVEYWGHRTDIAEILAQSQIVCLPSYREGLPKTLLEAAAAGRAIVTTDVPGCREVVQHDENGLLVPARSARGLREALERLLSDPDLCSRMGKRGRALAENYFSIDGVVSRTIQIYRQLLQQ